MTSPPSLRPVPMPVEHWKAWRMVGGIGYPIGFDTAPETVGEVVGRALAATAFNPGDMLAIQHSHEGRNEYRLGIYAVKRSGKNGTWRASYNGGRRVFDGRLEEKLMFAAELTQPFAPVEPFDAFRDNPVGLDLSLVNQ
jgi:hypothetical protein